MPFKDDIRQLTNKILTEFARQNDKMSSQVGRNFIFVNLWRNFPIF